MGWRWSKSHYKQRKKSPHESWLLCFPPALQRCSDRGEAVSVPAFSSGNLRSLNEAGARAEFPLLLPVPQSSQARAEGNGLLSQELWQLGAVGALGALQQLLQPHRTEQVLSRSLSLQHLHCCL